MACLPRFIAISISATGGGDEADGKENPEAHLGFADGVIAFGEPGCDAVGGGGEGHGESVADDVSQCNKTTVIGIPVIWRSDNLDGESVVEGESTETNHSHEELSFVINTTPWFECLQPRSPWRRHHQDFDVFDMSFLLFRVWCRSRSDNALNIPPRACIQLSQPLAALVEEENVVDKLDRKCFTDTGAQGMDDTSSHKTSIGSSLRSAEQTKNKLEYRDKSTENLETVRTTAGPQHGIRVGHKTRSFGDRNAKLLAVDLQIDRWSHECAVAEERGHWGLEGSPSPTTECTCEQDDVRDGVKQIRSTGNVSTYISSRFGTKIFFDQGFPVSLRYENAEVMREEYLYAPQLWGL
ncbi:putative MFS transporter, partial [Aureobasidium melanogenum]